MTDAQLKDKILSILKDVDEIDERELIKLLNIDQRTYDRVYYELAAYPILFISSMSNDISLEWNGPRFRYVSISEDGLNFLADGKSFAEQEQKLKAKKARLLQKEEEEIDLRRKEVNYAAISAKSSNSSAKAAWFSGIIAGTALLLTGFQFYLSFQQANEIERLKSNDAVSNLKMRSLDSLVRQLLKNQSQTRFRMDSLPTGTIQKKRIDSVSKAS